MRTVFLFIPLPNIITVIKSRRIRWARHVTRTEDDKYTRRWSENPKEEDSLETTRR